jgi:hypothetical protein
MVVRLLLPQPLEKLLDKPLLELEVWRVDLPVLRYLQELKLWEPKPLGLEALLRCREKLRN